MEPISGIVVAGGVSRRLGQDKRALRLWGEGGPTLLEHTVGVLAPLCAELIVVLNDSQAWPQLQVTLVADAYPDAGALGGIATGLRVARHDYALVVAADMPLLDADLLAAMLARPRTYQALVPRTPHGKTRNALGFEPLHAVYSQACLPVLRAMLDAGERRVVDFLAHIRVEVFEPSLTHDAAHYRESFTNINTPADLAAVQARLHMGGAE